MRTILITLTILLSTACEEPVHYVPSGIYCAQVSLACCEGDVVCENESYAACCEVEDCDVGLVEGDRLHDEVAECRE